VAVTQGPTLDEIRKHDGKVQAFLKVIIPRSASGTCHRDRRPATKWPASWTTGGIARGGKRTCFARPVKVTTCRLGACWKISVRRTNATVIAKLKAADAGLDRQDQHGRVRNGGPQNDEKLRLLSRARNPWDSGAYAGRIRAAERAACVAASMGAACRSGTDTRRFRFVSRPACVVSTGTERPTLWPRQSLRPCSPFASQALDQAGPLARTAERRGHCSWKCWPGTTRSIPHRSILPCRPLYGDSCAKPA